MIPMTGRFDTDIDKLTAPGEDGATLVWPDARSLPGMVAENRRTRQAYDFPWLGRSTRERLANLADRPPVIMTGHQPEFLHPGVWAKNVVAVRLAKLLGGEAEFLIVDNDAPHEIAIRWPDFRPGRCRERRHAGLPPDGRSYEQLPTSSRESWRDFFAAIPEAVRSFSGSVLEHFERGFLGVPASTDEDHLNYVEQWVAGVAAIDSAVGVASPAFVPVGRLFSGEAPAAAVPPADFIAHLMQNADAFAAAYNGALEDYRRRRGIRGTHHPIPDLLADGDRIELPFWMWFGPGRRRRLFVSRPGPDSIGLWADRQWLCKVVAGELRARPAPVLAEALAAWHVRPRALTLTMYARLLACDLFIHGVGGAKYDQITDDIIRRFFGVRPPSYACVSATLRLPLERRGVSDETLRARQWDLRDIRYNPQRHIHETDWSAESRSLFAERQRAIDDGRRLRLEEPSSRAARRNAFERIHAANRALLESHPSVVERNRRGVEETRRRLECDRIAARRDWFVGLYPASRLRELCDSLPLG